MLHRHLLAGLGLALWSWFMGISASAQEPQPPATAARPRVRDVGLVIGELTPGPFNAITDVEGVRVGHQTLQDAEGVRTGVTAVLPHPGNLFQEKVPAAVIVGNGFGKLIGTTQIEELGVIETPILLTNTLSAFAAADALVAYTLRQPGNETVVSVNAVVGECNDAYLNDIRAQNVDREAVYRAIAAARPEAVPEGSVGAGTGTRCLGWKGGIGTSSRRLTIGELTVTVGVLVQTNFGGRLTIAGVPVGKHLAKQPRPAIPAAEPAPSTPATTPPTSTTQPNPPTVQEKPPAPQTAADAGSCMIVVATDAPLDARRLERLARRALLALPAVGSNLAHGSGDYVIAFSTHPSLRTTAASQNPIEARTVLRDDALNPLFVAAREATEEAILNSLFQATTTTGFQGHTVEALPLDRVVELCRERGVIADAPQPPDTQPPAATP